MYVRKNFPLFTLIRTSGAHLIWMTLLGFLAVFLYNYTGYKWLAIPWLPASLVGTAVAFYLGFKNNSSYDRMWEARKIWGSIINNSRSFATMLKNYTTNMFTDEGVPQSEINKAVKQIIFRHIAWLYQLREQLLLPAPWEHINGFLTSRLTAKRMLRIKSNFNIPPVEQFLGQYLSADEIHQMESDANKCTQLLDRQSTALKMLREKDLIDDFRHIALQDQINKFLADQGKSERIKKFPFPRQYGSISFYFISIFIILIPFGMIGEFNKLGEGFIWLTVPFTTVVGWVFLMMELVGDYSENPFENLQNDIPMYSLCRTIEIDLLQMIGETSTPPPVAPKKGVLM